MARPRQPHALAKITGATIKNAGRYKNRADPKVRSLGPAPKWFNESQVAIWNDFNSDIPWLGRSDRSLVEIATVAQWQVRNDPACPAAVLAQLRLILSSMGATPIDRTKISPPDEKDADPADEFLN